MIPDELPCWEKEKEKILEFVENGIKSEGSTTSLFISGMPGTGKTATTMEVLRKVKDSHKNVKLICINGMTLSNPHQIYS